MHLAQPPESWGEDFCLTSGLQMIASSPPEQDPLDDVFGPDPDAPGHGLTASAARDNSEISLDTQRLRAQHNTVGYREGITAGKAGSIQTGFDQGFSLGANIGMKAGQILGLLEGISAALAEAGPTDEVVRVQGLLSQATAELNPESLFTPDYWASDGTWTYPITPLIDGDEVTYLDVADQHPLILKWKRMARDEADRWHVDQLLPILENNESSAQDEVAALETASRPETTSRDAIEW
ncbi:hypothetical protein FHL15_000574 [Xylaria flabelliformis]|uniref:Protein YAE1 n=1 Tax=Xylaria flabelliformis TaxID=2512241 RepID=A0A553IE79_9PEZI|nr:hypothetical protein FHL15_000574 [Xylaria flabelliformis]